MATETVKTVQLETQGAQKSLADLRKQINDCKTALFGLTEGSEEYKDKMQELGYAQQELTSFMNATRQGCASLEGSYNALSYQMSQLKQAYKETSDEAERSQLAAQISGLNEQLKEMDAAVGNYSRNVGNYVGSMNEVFGNLGITVGNLGPIFNTLANSAYAAGATGKSAFAGLAAGAKSLGASLKSLAANPVGAVIMAIVVAVKALKAVFDAVKNSIHGNEEAEDALAQAMVPVKAIVDAVKLAFDSLVEAITKVTGAIGNAISGLMEFLGIASDAVDKEQQIADKQDELDKTERQYIVENSKLSLEASDLRAKATDKENYAAKDRLKYAKQYGEKQKEIAKNNLDLAQKELKLLQLQASTGKNSTEMNKKLAEATAKVNQVQEEYNNTLRTTNKMVNSINSEIKTEETAAHKAAAEAAKKHAEEMKKLKDEYKGILDKINENIAVSEYAKTQVAIQKYAKETREKLQNEYKKHAINKTQFTETMKLLDQDIQKQEKDNYDKLLNNQKTFWDTYNSFIDDQYTSQTKQMRSKFEKEFEAIQSAWDQGWFKGNEKAYVDAMNKMAEAEQKAMIKLANTQDTEKVTKKYEELIKRNENVYDEVAKQIEILYYKREITTKEYTERIKNNEQEQRDVKLRTLQAELAALEVNEETAAKRTEISNKITEIEVANAKAQADAMDAQEQKYVDSINGMIDATTELLTSLSSIGDGISSKWANVGKDLSNVFKEVTAAQKSGEKGFKKWGQVGAAAVGTISSMFGALADQQDTDSKEGFESAKKLRYGEAVMSTAEGILQAWTSALELPAPYGPALGAALSAMMAALGAEQIAAISKTKFDGGSSSSTSSTSASSRGVSMSMQAPVQYTQAVNDSQNQETKVYVLESDIKRTMNKVSVSENEARF